MRHALIAAAAAALLITSTASAQLLDNAPDLPNNHVDVIGFYNPNATPAGSVSASYSHKIAPNTVNISLVDVTFQPFVDRSVRGVINNVTQAHISTTNGLGQRVAHLFDFDILAVGAVGIQTTAGGSSPAGFSGTGGFVGLKPIGKRGWTLDFAARMIGGTSKPGYVFGIGFGKGDAP